ncbi:hypothetical protein LSAT2_030887 [Lamellibrachia satsuma]|nr:hypothetical protein LSAT2_030887 [Lamellibrachia satsuma]
MTSSHRAIGLPYHDHVGYSAMAHHVPYHTESTFSHDGGREYGYWVVKMGSGCSSHKSVDVIDTKRVAIKLHITDLHFLLSNRRVRLRLKSRRTFSNGYPAGRDGITTCVEPGDTVNVQQTASVESTPRQLETVDVACNAKTWAKRDAPKDPYLEEHTVETTSMEHQAKRDAPTDPHLEEHTVETTSMEHQAPHTGALLVESTTQESDTTMASQCTDVAADIATNTMEPTVDVSTENIGKLSYSLAQMIDSFTQDAHEKNDEFVRTTWARAQRDNLSPDAFNRLLCEHSGDIENLRRIREAESRKLKEELERLKRKIHSRQTEDMSSGRLPTTKEDMESILAEHSHRHRQHMKTKAATRQSHNDKLQKKLQRQKYNKTSHEKTAPPEDAAVKLIREHTELLKKEEFRQGEHKKVKDEELKKKVRVRTGHARKSTHTNDLSEVAS